MLFTSISFLYYFLPIILIAYFLVPTKFKNLVLFIFSCIFYLYGEPKYILLMLFEILVAYIGGILIEKYKEKNIFIISIMIPIFLLIFFKYTDFFITNINNVFKANIPLLNIALPIGISFYTFQLISYLIDVYRGTVKAQKNFILLGTYISLFPQLIAGPIVRYETIEKELTSRKHNFELFANGTKRFVIGLSKKILIANILGELSSVTPTTTVFYWLYGISYMLQIYFDFSAYSDMAIGLGQMFGFHFLENFNYPYISKTITDFWRRWHISLGSWFRDYIYIPLGGNRKKQMRNILVVWFLTGFWHGASWNFIFWGLLFGIVLIIEKLLLKKHLEKLHFINHIYVLFIVMISFIIFNANSLADAYYRIIGLFGYSKVFIDSFTIYYIKNYIFVLLIALMGSTPLIKNSFEKLKNIKFFNCLFSILEPIVILALLILCTSYLIDNSYNPFLYFRF